MSLDLLSKMSSEEEEDNGYYEENGVFIKYCMVKDLEETVKNNDEYQRYQLLVMVTSGVFDTKDIKTSVWIEDPTESGNKTIMMAWNIEARNMLKEHNLIMNGQYIITNALLSLNNTQKVNLTLYPSLSLILNYLISKYLILKGQRRNNTPKYTYEQNFR